MSRFAAVVLVLCLSISSATTQTGDDIKQAKGEVASELQVCSIYFRIGRSCLSLQEPALARSYGEMSDKVADLAISGFRAVGVSDEVYAAQESLYTEAMRAIPHVRYWSGIRHPPTVRPYPKLTLSGHGAKA